MPEVVYKNVMTHQQSLRSGGRIESEQFDVNGAKAVHLMLTLLNGDPNVFWSVHFGSAQSLGFTQTATGAFDANGGMAAVIPVFGPQMLVMVDNRGKFDTFCDGKIYFVREVT